MHNSHCTATVLNKPRRTQPLLKRGGVPKVASVYLWRFSFVINLAEYGCFALS
jgi:hypothetical protein